MVGTAVASFLLGPWWGAIVGILTQGINAQLFPTEANVVLSPWVLVNLTGGIFWGLMARKDRFRQYLIGTSIGIRNQIKSHFWYLFWFGVVGASVMAIASVIVTVALGGESLGFATNSAFGADVQGSFTNITRLIHDRVKKLSGRVFSAASMRRETRWDRRCGSAASINLRISLLRLDIAFAL